MAGSSTVTFWGISILLEVYHSVKNYKVPFIESVLRQNEIHPLRGTSPTRVLQWGWKGRVVPAKNPSLYTERTGVPVASNAVWTGNHTSFVPSPQHQICPGKQAWPGWNCWVICTRPSGNSFFKFSISVAGGKANFIPCAKNFTLISHTSWSPLSCHSDGWPRDCAMKLTNFLVI